MRDFFTQQGTTYQHSCTYTAQQNEVVNHKLDISLSQHALFVFKIIFPYNFGHNVFPLLSILLTVCPCLFYHVRHLLSAYIVKSLLIHIRVFGCLAYLMKD